MLCWCSEEQNETEMNISRPDILLQKALDILLTGDVRCSKKAVADKLNINSEEVNHIFHALLEKGFVTQKPNRHFTWQGEQA